MAIIEQCTTCGAEFSCSASSPRWQCRKCDGTEAAEQAEEARWAALTPDQKADELRKRVMNLEQRSRWDGRIG